MTTSSPYIIPIMVVALMSLIGSAAVVITCVKFKEMRDKLFMQMIAFMSISDLLGNIAYAMPDRPSSSNWWCQLSGFLNITFYPISWLWTTVLVYFLYCLATTGRVPTNITLIHAFCWGLPLGFSLISLGFSTLGRESYYYDFQVCSEYGGMVHSAYHGLTYYGLLLGSFLAMIWMRRGILAVEKVGDARIFQPTYVIAKSSLRLYPLALFVCWLPHMILVFIQYDHEVGGDVFTVVYVIAEMLKILHGLVTAVIFFHKSSEARKLWYKYFFGSGKSTTHEVSEYGEESFCEEGSLSFAMVTPKITTNGSVTSSLHSNYPHPDMQPHLSGSSSSTIASHYSMSQSNSIHDQHHVQHQHEHPAAVHNASHQQHPSDHQQLNNAV